MANFQKANFKRYLSLRWFEKIKKKKKKVEKILHKAIIREMQI